MPLQLSLKDSQLGTLHAVSIACHETRHRVERGCDGLSLQVNVITCAPQLLSSKLQRCIGIIRFCGDTTVGWRERRRRRSLLSWRRRRRRR